MIFNTNFKLGPLLEPLSQEEILNTPEFYAMSLDNILASGKCPDHLRKILQSHPWGDRPNVIQVRPQDWRVKEPHVLGRGWHSDANTHLRNGVNQISKSLYDFRLFVCSFGDVVETEFLKGPIEIDINKHDPYDHVGFAGYVASIEHQYERVRALPNQLVEYTSRDVHRISPHYKIGNARVIIVSYEHEGDPIPVIAGSIGPSIKEKNA